MAPRFGMVMPASFRQLLIEESRLREYDVRRPTDLDPGLASPDWLTMAAAYRGWLRRAEAAAPWGEKVRRSVGRIYRSKGERHQLSAYYQADFTVEVSPPITLAKVG